MSKTLAIDFDGVIHAYSKGWHDGTIYDEPLPGAFETIKKLMDDGYCVYILSTRKPRQIQKWLDKHLWFYDPMVEWENMGYHEDKNYLFGFKSEVIKRRPTFWNKDHVLGVTNRKLPALAYLDDRAVLFTNWQKAGEDLCDA